MKQFYRNSLTFPDINFREELMAQIAFKTCDICSSALERHLSTVNNVFCGNCRGLHTRQTATRQHEFQESSQMKTNFNYTCKELKIIFSFVRHVIYLFVVSVWLENTIDTEFQISAINLLLIVILSKMK